MNFFEIIKIALISLNRNKIRSFLTSMSIVIGIASVVGIVAFGQGIYNSIQEEFLKRGNNIIMIFPGGLKAPKIKSRGSMLTLKPEDANAILSECNSVCMVSPVFNYSRKQEITYNNKSSIARSRGVTDDYFKITCLDFFKGRNFTSSEVYNGEKVCIISKKIANSLFPHMDPIDKTVKFSKIPFKVIGVWDDKDSNTIFMPFPIVQKRFLKTKYCNFIYLSAISHDSVAAAKKEVEEVLRRRHKIDEGSYNDFVVWGQDNIIKMRVNTQATIYLLFVSVASITLLVGGIGVMNIMLVSVSERTSEIGIRMAVGAKSSDIMWQFLIESVVLTCVSGIIGILCGIGLSKVIKMTTSYTPIVSMPSIVIAVLFSISIGIIFGLFPAYKASRLEPIEAIQI